jgi:alpha-N-arabinofuranosidase
MHRIFASSAALLKGFCFVALVVFWDMRAFAGTENEKATVTVSVDKVTAQISPLIYGQFVEHLGRAIYGGLYEENSPLSDENGFRTDVLEKVKALHPPLMRYPGGTVTKIYHWKDGIGPKNDRPVRRNLIWGGEDSNHMGTDEFMAYANLIEAAPFLTVNMATGSAEEASDWVEYCNAEGNSRYAALRRAHGHPSPYRVKYHTTVLAAGTTHYVAAAHSINILQVKLVR